MDDRFQAAAALGEAVFDPGWDLGVHHALFIAGLLWWHPSRTREPAPAGSA